MSDLFSISSGGEVAFNYLHCDPLVVREKIRDLTQRMLSIPAADKSDLLVEHEICDGMYLRKMYIPKGTIVAGKVHKKPCMNIVAKGDISVLTESGLMRVSAGFHVASPKDLQKIGYAHEDTIFINVFRTDETDIEKIEREIAWESYEAMDSSLALSNRELEVICQ